MISGAIRQLIIALFHLEVPELIMLPYRREQGDSIQAICKCAQQHSLFDISELTPRLIVVIGFPKLYTDFAKYYDLLESQYRDYEKEAKWVSSILERSNSRRLIDISCGTGRHVLEIGKLISMQNDIVATDASPNMIEVARKRIALDGTEMLNSDFMQLPFKSEIFDSAICMYWSLAGMNHAQTKQLFREVSRILEPSGVFIFDVENAEGVKTNLIDNPFIDAFFSDSDSQETIIRANLSRRIEEDIVDWHAYYLFEKDGLTRLVNDQMRLRFYSKSTLEAILKETRFEPISISSSPAGDYEQGSPSLYFVARKK